MSGECATCRVTRQRPPRLPMLLYRLLLGLLTPYLMRRLYREGRTHQESDYAPQRQGKGHPRFDTPPVWFHAASVGEVNAVAPLIEALQRARPELPLLLTTNTASGGRRGRERLPGVVQAYLPFDWRCATRRFLHHCQPRLGIIVETELWPNLYDLCNEAGLPLLIVNGRVSAKTLGAPAWLRRLYRFCLQSCRALLCRAEGDREGFIALGAEAARCRVVGNIKFAALNDAAPKPIALGRDYVLAASSRDGEERLIVEAWQGSGRDELLVIAPRHPQRLGEILADLAPFNLPLAVRSRGEVPGAATRLYIADTFGELRGFMAGAKLIFMGGSLVERGGHNLLEPAALGKAVITGPHMANFADETRTLLQGGGVRQVESVEELRQAFTTLLQDEGARQALGERARATLLSQRDVVARYLQALQAYL